MDRPRGRRVLKFDGAFGPEGGGIALSGDEYYNAACRGHVHIEYHNQDYHRPHRLRWMASHWIRGSRGSPYESSSLAHPSPLRGPLPLKGTQERYGIGCLCHM